MLQIMQNSKKDLLRGMYENLMDIIDRDADDNQRPVVRLHPRFPKDKYNETEIKAFLGRDFKTRLFMSSLNIDGNCFWIRTHHTDNADHVSNFTYIRDYWKAACCTQNHTAGKATLTAILTTLFAMDDSDYNSFASIVASGLADKGLHTSFEVNDNLLKNLDGMQLSRHQLVLLMDVIFSKISFKRFLIDRNHQNIFRLVHCNTKGNKDKKDFIYVFFSFLLQVCLTVFVMMQVLVGEDVETEKDFKLRTSLWVLASLGSLYSIVVAVPEIGATMEAFKIYGRLGPLQMIDFIVNVVIPIVLVISGFVLIVEEKDFITAVLNTTALLFIPEIDDVLPKLIGYDSNAIVENHLIKEAKIEYNEITTKLSQIGVSKDIAQNDDLGIEFNDYFITNNAERGQDTRNFALYQPYIVKNNSVGVEVDPSNYITEDCLLRSVEWKYTNYGVGKTTLPRVGYLKLVKLNGEEIEIVFSGAEKIDLGRPYFLDDGAYMITTFVMSSSILNLRLCGSANPADFLKAIKYYSMWDITAGAKALLQNQNASPTANAYRYGSTRERELLDFNC